MPLVRIYPPIYRPPADSADQGIEGNQEEGVTRAMRGPSHAQANTSNERASNVGETAAILDTISSSTSTSASTTVSSSSAICGTSEPSASAGAGTDVRTQDMVHGTRVMTPYGPGVCRAKPRVSTLTAIVYTFIFIGCTFIAPISEQNPP